MIIFSFNMPADFLHMLSQSSPRKWVKTESAPLHWIAYNYRLYGEHINKDDNNKYNL